MAILTFMSLFITVVFGAFIGLLLYLGPADVKHRINYYRTYFYIARHKQKCKKRFSTYDNLADPDATVEDLGLLPLPEERELENPQTALKEGFRDGIHIFGVDANKNFLDITISNIDSTQATVWIALKLVGKGTTYQLPIQPNTQYPHIQNKNIFSACGLQIQCTCPLRNWRVSFNGQLKKSSDDEYDDNNDLVHVKFSFVWVASSVVHDSKVNFNSKELANAFFSAGITNFQKENILNFQDTRDHYEQRGQLMGTVTIDNVKEQDLYLWSLRTRLLDKPMWNDYMEGAKLFLYFKSSEIVKMEIHTIRGLISNFISGYYITPLGSKYELINSEGMKQFTRSTFPAKTFVTAKKGNEDLNIHILKDDYEIRLHTGLFLKHSLVITPVTAQMGDETSFGVIYSYSRSTFKSPFPLKVPPIILKEKDFITCEEMVMSLENESCQNSSIAGGKGSSLAMLSSLSKDKKYFSVAKGFVVTTTAFNSHINANQTIDEALLKLCNASCTNIKNEILERECERCCHEIESTELSSALKSAIKDQMLQQFGSLEGVKFAVRSSACGEDSEELSCAGILSTFLGISGLDNVFKAVLKCWSSHFRFEAVKYCRQNGQPIKEPMAVVIQEMVASEVAGVMFTVDPVSGNPAYVYITANYGLGETVVSADVEPDTYILKKESDGLLNFHDMKLGSKVHKEVLKDDGGTEKIFPQENNFCLTKEWALKIGDIGLCVADCFCGPKDIEWAIVGKKLYLLQSRPVTTLHLETEFELFHEQDSPIVSSYQYYTTANTGEVFLGSVSPLGLSLVVNGMDVVSKRNFIIRQNEDRHTFMPFSCQWLPIAFKHVTLSLTDTLFRMCGKTISAAQKSFEVALFGRVIDADDIHRSAVKRYGYATRQQKLMAFYHLFCRVINPPNVKILHEEAHSLNIDIQSFKTSKDMFASICLQMKLFFKVSTYHAHTTFLSSAFNNFILTILNKSNEAWDNALYEDFAMLLSSCSGVESAEVPSRLREIAKAIYDTGPPSFASVSAEVAIDLLDKDDGEAGKLFHEFLEKHGHRCVNEFDVFSLSWGMQPQKPVEILQNMIKSTAVINAENKKTISVESAVSQLKTPITRLSKFILKMILPHCRAAVGKREQSKSMIIKVVDWLRKSCYHLGELLVEEGLLPAKELIFFLTLYEVHQLILHSNEQKLISKAIRRQRIHPILNSLKFPEIIAGIPKPVEIKIEEFEKTTVELKGTPACTGVVKARARVVTSLEKASLIQSGEILVTHATDIGWSPYFPLLSGVITVLGGLISHGAVVAREYGLPCLVGVQNATELIKSGDLILLDGQKGTVTILEVA